MPWSKLRFTRSDCLDERQSDSIQNLTFLLQTLTVHTNQERKKVPSFEQAALNKEEAVGRILVSCARTACPVTTIKGSTPHFDASSACLEAKAMPKTSLIPNSTGTVPILRDPSPEF